MLKAAMRKVDITPTTDVYLEGYGGRTEEYCAHRPNDFLSDIMARILMLEAGEERALYINVEMCISRFGDQTSEFFQNNLAETTGIPAENIFLCNTHCHQSTIKLDSKAEKAIEEACREAVNDLVEVTVGVDSYGTKYGISRSPSYTMDINTPYDNTLTIVRFNNAKTGDEVGMLYSVPMHNTAFSVQEGKNVGKLICEFTGYASRYLESKNADILNFTAIHMNGFYGNSGPYFEDTDAYYAKTVEELKRQGKNFGEEIYRYYKEIECASTEKYTIKSLLKNETMDRALNQTEAHIEQWGPGEMMPLEIYASSFGDIAFVGVNYEPFSTIGAHLRAESPYEHLLPAANVGGWRGYIALSDTFHTGIKHMETQPFKTPFDEKGEIQFYNYVMDALCEMKGVTLEKVAPAKTEKKEKDGSRIYSFEFAEEIVPDKIAVSFGQKSRLDCASEFVLELFDKEGNKTKEINVKDNSVNHVGFMIKDAKVFSAVMRVKSTYRSEEIRDIPIDLRALNFK